MGLRFPTPALGGAQVGARRSQTSKGLRAVTEPDPGRAKDKRAPLHPKRDIQTEAIVTDPEKRNGGKKVVLF